MKNLDIEKLERKNIYTTPPDFFASMQENVVRQIRETEHPVTEHRIGRPKTQAWYAAAAVIALILGGTFIYNADSGADSTLAENNRDSQETKINDAAYVENGRAAAPTATENYITLVEDLTLAENENQKERRQPAKEVQSEVLKKVIAGAPKAEMRMEMILDEFSAEDIAALSQNSEQDVYLDLYN